MAKKGKAKAQPAEKKAVSKKKSNTLLYALGVLILIVIIVLIIRSSRQPAPETPTVETPTAPVEKPAEEKPAVTGVEVQQYCGTGAAIGAKPGFCKKDAAGNVEFVMVHLGADTLSGIKYYVLDENGNVLKQDYIMESWEGKSEKTFKVTVDSNANRIEARAILEQKECLNQRALVNLNNC